MIKEILRKLVYGYYKLKISRRVTMLGCHYNVSKDAKATFADGSCMNDIILDDYVDLYGRLTSQSHGKIQIGKHTRVGINVKVLCVESIKIGNHVAIGADCVITDNSSHPSSALFRRVKSLMPVSSTLHLWKYSAHKPVVIEDNAWIGERSRICKGVTIGENSIVAANSVVTKDVPANSIAAGNPAKIVRDGTIAELKDPEDCEEFNNYLKINGTNL